jgi:hypothetical protein
VVGGRLGRAEVARFAATRDADGDGATAAHAGGGGGGGGATNVGVGGRTVWIHGSEQMVQIHRRQNQRRQATPYHLNIVV